MACYMDLDLPPQHAGFRDSVREIAQAVALALAAEVDRDHRFPEEAVSAAAEAGLLGILIPREFGGAGLDALAFTLCIDELAQACASTSVIVDVHTSVGSEPILLFGTQDQKRKWLPRLASGELLGAFALTEPAAGSDAASLKTSARRNGDGYILNGSEREQGDEFSLADMATRLASARLLAYRAAWLCSRGRPFTREASMAKLHSTDTAMQIALDAVQIAGEEGVVSGSPFERHVRDAKALQIYEGSNQVQRIVIAREVMQL